MLREPGRVSTETAANSRNKTAARWHVMAGNSSRRVRRKRDEKASRQGCTPEWRPRHQGLRPIVGRPDCGTPYCLTFQHAIFLFIAAILGGVLNALAGGGSFISFPALIFTGVPAINANATNTVALWTGVTASGGAYRKKLNLPLRVILPLVAAAVVGGVIGATLLLRTPATTFLKLLPWLMLVATLLFVFGRWLVRGRGTNVAREASLTSIVVATVFELLVGTYGGYFGGGMGFVLLAMLAAMGMSDIHSMNAMKSVLSSATNGIAVIIFIVKGAVYWPQAAVMIVGAVVGGYYGAHYAQRLPPIWVRRFVIAVGSAMTLYFFVKAYR